MNDATTQELGREVRQVLVGLGLNRQPGWNFPGNFLQISFDELGGDHARISIDAGPHCEDADGQVNLAPFSVLADIALASTMRGHLGRAIRMATVAMTLQLTGAPRRGRLQADGHYDGPVAGVPGERQGLARAGIRNGDGELVCTASGTFMALHTHELEPVPLRRRGDGHAAEPLPVDELSDEEKIVYERACACAGPGEGAFIERFWSLQPQRDAEGASCEFVNGPHAGNRVGHTQGGLTFGLAAVTGQAALGPDWALVGISAWYLRPGTGPMLRARAQILHRGNHTGVVRVVVSDLEGRSVLEAVTHHSRLRQ